MKEIQLTKDQIGMIVGGALFAGLFVYVYLFYFWFPYSKQLEADTVKVEKLEREIDNARKQKAKFKDLEGKLASLQLEKEAAQKKLPKDKQLPELIKTLTDKSRKYGVTINSIGSASSVKEQYFTRVSYAVSVSGEYHKLGRFFTSLALEERIITMENLSVVSTPNAATGTMNGNFTLVSFLYNG
ncbi:MAG: type 4a pilus biogenesis protein PilO [Elusimicrobiales bacterium]|jgi:type IV pilus assembly protein PilO|nr:type 4a pilus biogenesis protein PilO [Elusimicrobiales bacterium]